MNMENNQIISLKDVSISHEEGVVLRHVNFSMNKGEFVSMESIQKVCKALNCDVGDICVINKVEED